MNKSEREAFEKLQDDLRIARALRFTEKIKPDIPAPKDGTTRGFLFNAYSSQIQYAASRTVSHATSYAPIKDTGFGGGWTQGGRAIYSSKLLAFKAMRYEVELECAKKLAGIDKQIEQEIAALNQE